MSWLPCLTPAVLGTSPTMAKGCFGYPSTGGSSRLACEFLARYREILFGDPRLQVSPTRPAGPPSLARTRALAGGECGRTWKACWGRARIRRDMGNASCEKGLSQVPHSTIGDPLADQAAGGRCGDPAGAQVPGGAGNRAVEGGGNGTGG